MGESERKRKRTTRASHSSSDGDEGDKKRGRPRVEKQDESAADRRRTQVRMAQRAYRQRKEGTLEELRKRVSELTDTLELMNKTFVELRDHLSGSANEEQLNWLRDTSRRYEALMESARTSSEEEFEPLPSKHQSLVATPNEEAGGRQRKNVPVNVPSWLDQSVLNEGERRRSPEPVGMGYTMYLDNTGEDRLIEDIDLLEQSRALVQKQPTRTTYDTLLNLNHDDIRIPQQLPTIQTYSFQETTFARQLHRSCLEAAYHVLIDPARQHIRKRIFKLSLLGDDPARLKTSLEAVLARGAQESLEFAEAPLLHVGGAGTHYPRRDLHGNLQSRRSTYNLGLVGPQTLALLESAAQNNVSADMTVEIAGYEGVWFDPYDVEGYLEERGIRIDPLQSFVEAEIDDDDISMSSSGPSTPPLEYSSTPDGLGQDPILPTGTVGFDKRNDFTDMTLTNVGYSDAMTGDWTNFLEPSQSTNGLDTHAQAGSNTPTVSWTDNSMPRLMQDSLMQSIDYSSFRPPPFNHRVPRKKNVIIDTLKLVKALTMRGVCLGPTPGFKRQDVDQALAMASFDL
ncbi:hypothetical protein LTS16_013108 [Friedmanniomyces endolithicus]|nr:hypothetical protein LTR38_012380 [Friedmanniomyces endolithicus]KAK0870329.1 hypothetical protein LTR87_013345 [Friedmanniomyces endolithicus]KAK0991918.1 hypothetical protein LTS01_008007 [Friedmanniomyces endolithicus]KAK1037113.1 hypothetical protein LTS16_013108 [Friedmanniomyces endolithicus]